MKARINTCILGLLSGVLMSGYGFADNDEHLLPYVDLGLGLSVHVLEESEEGAASQLLKTAIGVQWLPYISTQVGLWHWSNEEDKSESTEEERASFEGLSASWEITLQTPLSNKSSAFSYGPYYRFGRHCWSAVFSGLIQPWSKEGCSDIRSVGFVFPSAAKYEADAVLYLEFSHSDFAEVSTRSMQLGAKLAF